MIVDVRETCRGCDRAAVCEVKTTVKNLQSDNTVDRTRLLERMRDPVADVNTHVRLETG